MIDATPALRAYARWRLARLAGQDPIETQRRQLLHLVRLARTTRFGVAHGFDRIASVQAYQQSVPLRTYEDFWLEWWKPAFPVLRDISWPGLIPYFAATSGTTTGTTKFIPVSKAMMTANRKAALDILVHHVTARRDSRILAGRNFMLGGSTDLVRQAPGVRSGDLSGIAAGTVPLWARPYYFPPMEMALLSDWEQKAEQMARASLLADIRSISGTPSWVLPFFAKVAALAGKPDKPISAVYPNLELFVHGGVDFRPYKAHFDELTAGSGILMREVYPASEGFIALADLNYGDGLRLLTDNGLFMEFVPVDAIGTERPPRFWLENVRTDVNYAVVLTTNAGLWSYVLGDTVRFISLQPPRVLITGRLSYMLSAFGEHLIAEEIEAAVQQAAFSTGSSIVEFTVAPRYPASAGGRGYHCFIVETSTTSHRIGRDFGPALDHALKAENADYAAHRDGMDPPTIISVQTGSFAAWMQMRGRLGGQNKVPRVINNPELFDHFLTFLQTSERIVASFPGTEQDE